MLFLASLSKSWPTLVSDGFFDRHRQFKTGKLGGRNTPMTELWDAALAA
jgi:hypothetical protein